MTSEPSRDPFRLRAYRSEDRDACLAIFDGHVPRYFATHERDGYETFLVGLDRSDPDRSADTSPNAYFVVADAAGDARGIIGCGGIAWNDRAAGLAVLTWGMVRHDLLQRGVGRFLLRERLRRLAVDPSCRTVRIETSQHTRDFFARAGFIIRAIEPDGFAAGIDRLDMTLDVTTLRDAILRDAILS